MFTKCLAICLRYMSSILSMQLVLLAGVLHVKLKAVYYIALFEQMQNESMQNELDFSMRGVLWRMLRNSVHLYLFQSHAVFSPD